MFCRIDNVYMVVSLSTGLSEPSLQLNLHTGCPKKRATLSTVLNEHLEYMYGRQMLRM